MFYSLKEKAEWLNACINYMRTLAEIYKLAEGDSVIQQQLADKLFKTIDVLYSIVADHKKEDEKDDFLN